MIKFRKPWIAIKINMIPKLIQMTILEVFLLF